jgi:cytochrome P450
MVFRYEDVKRALSDRALSSSEAYALDGPRNMRMKAAGADDAYLLRPSLSKLDPPGHAPLRRLLARPFTPKNVERYEARAAEIARELLDNRGSSGELELVRELARPLPLRLVCEIFGIPVPDDPERLFSWTWKGLNLLDPFLTSEQFADFIAAQREFAAYVRDVIAWKRGHLADDVLSDFIAAGDEGSVIGPDQVAATVHTLVIAGFDTTVNQTGLSVLALLRHPAQWERLVRDNSLLNNAVEELLRYEPTSQFQIRTTPSDYRIGDTVIPAGNHVVPWLAAANRDERHFGPDAGDLDIGRVNARDHVAFGAGPHACLGAWLARLEIRIVLHALASRAPRACLNDDEPAWGSTAFIRGLEELRVGLG